VFAAQVLNATRVLDDLPRLAAALGCEMTWEEIPPHYWVARRGGIPPGRSALIGRLGPLPWFGIESPSIHQSLRQVAGQLVRRGEPAAVVGVDPAGPVILLTVAFPGSPLVTLVPAVEPEVVQTWLERIPRVVLEGRLATAARLSDLIATEGIGTRFFLAFEKELERIASSLTGRRPDERRAFALLQLNRVLFLYFVQSKGWLDGKPDFLRRQVDRCLSRRKQLDRHLLGPLFFGTLNRPPADRTRATLMFGRIPFLNGGLFEPHPIEKRRHHSVSNEVWRDVFDNLFERFQFTAAEGATTAIAPDMLGRVFEGVMQPRERRATGTFYTPPALVRSLLDESLLALTVERLGIPEGRAARLMADRDPVLHPILGSLRLLDPAVGSGAFLLAALDRFAGLAESDSAPPAEIRRRVLQTNLFGVDLNPTAVRLTELRLWLAVIAGDGTTDPDLVAPLPNLDCLVRQGDSLTDPLGFVARMPFRAGAMGAALAELRLAFGNATGATKRKAAGELQRAEREAMNDCLALAERQLEHEVDECLGAARRTDLFGRTIGADGSFLGRLRGLRRRLGALRQARRRLVTEGEVGWFQYEAHFADVFSRQNGFDLVVGNPPWVRAEKLPMAVREQLSGRYYWWRGSSDGAGYRHQPDLAVAFLERAHELAAPGGVVGFLVPAKIATAAYGSAARRAMARDLTLHLASDIASGQPHGFDATVYPMALVSVKRRPKPEQLVRLELERLDGARIAQRELAGGAPWILQHPAAARVARELGRRFPPLGQTAPIHLGVKTGANGIFLHPPATVEPDVRREAVRGRDIRPFQVTRTVSIFWPYDDSGHPLQRLPPGALHHVLENERALRARVDYTGGLPWILFRTAAARPEPRVVWSDLARNLTAAALVEPEAIHLVPLNTCYVMAPGTSAMANALTAWLNSSWIRWIARLGADPASSGYARFNARTVGATPLPPSVLTDTQLAEWAARARRNPDQNELDDLAARHLDLPASELRTLASLARAGTDHRR
jgi:hypothetical protein